MKPLLISLTCSLFLAVSLSHAGDPEAGKAKAAVCANCHGADGIGTAEIYPNLAGQKAGYLVSSIKAYKNGDRKGGMTAVMAPMVSTLSDEDIADIAAYYSGLAQ